MDNVVGGELTRADIAKMLELLTKAVNSIGEVVVVVTEADRRSRRTKWAMTVVAVTLVVTVAFVISSRSVIGAIEDCTKSSGVCYQQNQSRTGNVVKPINDKLDLIIKMQCDATAPERRPASCPPG